MQQPRSAQDMLNTTLKAEAEGVPVDWKRVAMQLFESANGAMNDLVAKNNALEQECVDAGLRANPGPAPGDDDWESPALDKVFEEDEREGD